MLCICHVYVVQQRPGQGFVQQGTSHQRLVNQSWLLWVAGVWQVVWMTDTSEEAAKRRAAEQLSAATAAMVTQGNIEAERAEAEKKAKKEAKRKVSDRAWTRGGA